jgi:hypothetical protein
MLQTPPGSLRDRKLFKMTTNLKNSVVYVPSDTDATEDRWAVVAASLRAAGVVDIRPAPMPAQNFKPRHLRSPLMLSSVEI